MTLLHLHLITNHIPVLGVAIGLIFYAWGYYKNSQDIKNFALYYFVVIGLLSLVAYFTGEPAEEGIEKIVGISKEAIEEHEEAALFGLIGVELIALLSLAGIFKKEFKLNKVFQRALLLLAVVTSILMARVAFLGGEIRHTELVTPEASSEQSPH